MRKKGAHNPDYIAPPNADELERLIMRAKPLERFHTICAPEVPGAEEMIRRAVSLGATVSIGHSNADCETCQKAVEWGAKSYTHLYNAMSALKHRDPGCVGAASRRRHIRRTDLRRRTHSSYRRQGGIPRDWQ